MKRKRGSAPRGKTYKKRYKSYSAGVQQRTPTMLEELKVLDTTLAASIDTAGIVIPISDAAVGTAYNQRIGQHIKIKSVEMRAEMAAAAGDGTNFIQWRIIRWDDTGTPTAAQLTSDAINSFVSFANINIIDKCQTLAWGQLACVEQTETELHAVHCYRKVNYQTAKWLAGTNTRDAGQLYFVAYSDSGAVAHPAVRGKVRVRYIG